jgi:hypothetical protein
MATSSGGGIGNTVSFKAAGDLSTKQYCGVYLTAANTVGTASVDTNTPIIGILQNKPKAAGSPADVLMINNCVSKIVTSGTIAAGAKCICGTDARFRAALSADAVTTVQALIAVEASTTAASAGGGDIITAISAPAVGTTS